MSFSILILICALFMIGRNIPSLIFKIRDLVKKDKRKMWLESPTRVFTVIILICTAIAGLVDGLALFLSILYPNIIFGYYMFIVVGGMMIYSYFVYAGNCFEEKKWFMFSVCFFVIIFTAILVSLVSYNIAVGFYS